jgi:NTP pyrophosphatase (non-canonical NTP hydrolase)
MKHSSIGYLGAVIATAILSTACGHPEKLVVDKYFQAVNAKDNQTLGSFALVGFDKKVDNWSIKRTVSENKEAAPLAELVKKQKEIETKINDNKREYNKYFLDHMTEVDEYREAKKRGEKTPAKLTAVATEWDKYTDTEKQLKKQLGDAKLAVEREKKNMMVSVGNVDEVEGLEGEVLTKQIELDLLVEGQSQPYLMTLKKYDVKPAGGGAKVISRWVVTGLQKA